VNFNYIKIKKMARVTAAQKKAAAEAIAKIEG
jgi:hypothetical protein